MNKPLSEDPSPDRWAQEFCEACEERGGFSADFVRAWFQDAFDCGAKKMLEITVQKLKTMEDIKKEIEKIDKTLAKNQKPTVQ